jgi:hypothetical protein
MHRRVIAISLLLSLAGCFDHRGQIAMAILYPPGQVTDNAFAGALLGRFPVGSPVANLRQLVESLGGSCQPAGKDDYPSDYPHELSCRWPEAGGVCWMDERIISVKLNGDRIAGIRVDGNAVSC